jgi:hypothetical protein
VSGRWRVIRIAALAACLGYPALAQQQAPAPGMQQQQPPQAPVPGAPAQPQQGQQGQQQRPGVAWERLPRMQLEQMYGGPLQDTVIQRWRDPQTGTLCYLYLPFTVQHSATTATGAVQYGANTIGSLSCFESASAPRAAAPQPGPPAAAAKKPPAHTPARASGEPAGQQ